MHEREWEDGIVGMKMVHLKVAMHGRAWVVNCIGVVCGGCRGRGSAMGCMWWPWGACGLHMACVWWCGSHEWVVGCMVVAMGCMWWVVGELWGCAGCIWWPWWSCVSCEGSAGCMWWAWWPWGACGLYMVALSCLWKTWTCEGNAGCMRAGGWPYGGHGWSVGCMWGRCSGCGGDGLHVVSCGWVVRICELHGGGGKVATIALMSLGTQSPWYFRH